MADDEFDNLYREGARQAKELQEQASKGGLRFEVFLPDRLASWILDKVANGIFMDPSEAVFVFLGECYDIEPYADLQDLIFQRRIQKGLDSSDPGISIEEFKKEMEEWFKKPQPEPAVWKNKPTPTEDDMS